MADGDVEIEAKWRADGGEHDRLRAALRRAGGALVGTVRELNTLFDSADDAMRASGRVLRLRCVDAGPNTLTFKGPATYRDGLKVRAEIELHVTDLDAVVGLLDGLGFSRSLEYAKTRESWDLDGAQVTLDTLEFGRFVEVEGTEDSVRRTARLLGLELSDAERSGYPRLMRAWRARERAD